MQLKFELAATEQHPRLRKKFHMRQKMRRSVKCAKDLQTLVSQNTQLSAVTRTEVRAYETFIEACLRVEQHEWLEATRLFGVSRSAYGELIELVKGTNLTDLYSTRCHEVDALLKLCRSECGNADTGGGEGAEVDTALAANVVDSLNLDVYEQDKAASAAPKEVLDETLTEPKKKEIDGRPAKKRAKMAAQLRKEAIPLKPFFFDLALNFVESPVDDKK